MPVDVIILAIRLAQAAIGYSVEDNRMHFQSELEQTEEFETEPFRDDAHTNDPRR